MGAGRNFTIAGIEASRWVDRRVEFCWQSQIVRRKVNGQRLPSADNKYQLVGLA